MKREYEFLTVIEYVGPSDPTWAENRVDLQGFLPKDVAVTRTRVYACWNDINSTCREHLHNPKQWTIIGTSVGHMTIEKPIEEVIDKLKVRDLENEEYKAHNQRIVKSNEEMTAAVKLMISNLAARPGFFESIKQLFFGTKSMTS